MAAEQGHLMALKAILRRNPDFDLKDKNGLTALDLAWSAGQETAATQLCNEMEVECIEPNQDEDEATEDEYCELCEDEEPEYEYYNY